VATSKSFLSTLIPEKIFRKFQQPEFRRKLLKGILIGFFTITFLMILVVSVFFWSVARGQFGSIPSYSELAGIENQISTEVYASGGELLGKYFIYDRTHVNLSQISPNVINSLIATEDVRFYKHTGVDYRSMGRVMIKTLLLQQSSAGGGSTLTQQLAKNIYPRQNNGILSIPVNKAREIIIARKLERTYSKDEILLLYLNTVPFGENVFGISAASLRFFNKNPYDLNIEEAAVLIGMLKATTFYNPRQYSQRTIARRNTVIGQLSRYEFITPEQADSLMKLPLVLNYNPMAHNLGPAAYFREQVRRQSERIIREYNEANGTRYNIYTDGLKIHTTIDYTLQLSAEQALRKQMASMQKIMDDHYKNTTIYRVMPILKTLMPNSSRYKSLKRQRVSDEEIETNFQEKVSMELFSWDKPVIKNMSPMDSIFRSQQILHSGLVSIDPSNGHVKAWVGGNDFRYFQFDNVIAQRQAGSAFKPFLFATALEMGIDPCEMVSNEIRVYEDYEDWAPVNASGMHEGYYSMKGALAQSSNTVSSQYIMQTGSLNVIETARKAGISGTLPAVPSLALGTANVSLLELTAAYAIFLKAGNPISPKWIVKIEDKNGRILFQDKPSPALPAAISEQTAMIMQDMLQSVVTSGTANSLMGRFGIRSDIAGKTGTTQNNADTWFIGFSPGLITGVWTGIENPAFTRVYRTPLGSGASAVPVWGEFTRMAIADQRTNKYFTGSFTALPDTLAALLDCPMYLEELPTWIDRLFGTGPEETRQRTIRRRQQEREPSRLRRFFRDAFQRD
jgi:penicillin-binding protein 1A